MGFRLSAINKLQNVLLIQPETFYSIIRDGFELDTFFFSGQINYYCARKKVLIVFILTGKFLIHIMGKC